MRNDGIGIILLFICILVQLLAMGHEINALSTKIDMICGVEND
jgi:hypothetical protein